MTDNANHPGAVLTPPPAGAVCWPLMTAALVLAGCMTQPVVPITACRCAGARAFSVGRPASRRAARPWTVAPPAEAQPRGEWWLGFQDPALADLVQRAGSANTSIQQAAGRLALRPARCCARPTPRAQCRWAHRPVSPAGRCRHHGQRHPATLGTAGLQCVLWLDLVWQSCRKPTMLRGWTPMPAPRCCKARA